jgi:hypothetical protein
MEAAAEVMRTIEGCVDASVRAARESETVVSTGSFTSEEAWTRSVRAVLEGGLDSTTTRERCARGSRAP